MAPVRRRGWRYFATRLNGDGTETLLDPDLPLEDVEIEDVLSGDNAIGGKIDPVYRRILGPDGFPIIKPWSTAIYAEADGEIRSGGIVVSAPRQGPSLSMEAVGFTGYLRDLPYVGTGYKGIRVDPMDVVRTIWSHAQGKPFGDLGMVIDTTTSPKRIGTELEQVEFDTASGPVSFEAGPYKLNWYTTHDLAGNIDALAAETPFDYHERHYWQGDQIIHRLDLGYPSLGRIRKDLRFVLGVNIFESPEVENDGSIYASGTMVLGAGDGPAMVKSVRETPTRPAGLRRIAIVIDDTIKTQSKADKRADDENQWRSRLDDITTLEVTQHRNAPLGSCQVGDQILVEGRDDWGAYEMWVRVLSISYSPEQGSQASYTVTRVDKLTS